MPTIRKSPWAKLITRIEPKMMPSPTHIRAYVLPTRMPALSAWRKSTEENGIRGMSAQYSSVSSGRDDRRSTPRESLVFCCRSLEVWPVATGCATPAGRGELGGGHRNVGGGQPFGQLRRARGAARALAQRCRRSICRDRRAQRRGQNDPVQGDLGNGTPGFRN